MKTLNLKDVIGKAGERVSLAAAMADNERYWVDPDSLEIWDRDYRRNFVSRDLLKKGG